MPSTSSTPAAASHYPEGSDGQQDAASKEPPSPRGPKTPKQEAEIESCATEEKHYVNTGTLTPKPEVRESAGLVLSRNWANPDGDVVRLFALQMHSAASLNDSFSPQVDAKGKIGPTSLKENVCQVRLSTRP